MSPGIVAGSLDPITNGHLYVIKQALSIVETVNVVIATNRSKKYTFSNEEKEILIIDAVREQLGEEFADRVVTTVLAPDIFLFDYAKIIGASSVFRGIRNTADFEFERTSMEINSKIQPNISTMFVMPPADLTCVSSSMVKSMLNIKGWEKAVKDYVPPNVIEALNNKCVHFSAFGLRCPYT